MLKMLEKVLGSKNDREIKKIQPIVTRIAAMEDTFAAMSDDELKSMTPKFKEKLEAGAELDDLLPAAFATVREVGKRTLNMRHYDVQMIGGIFLHRGMIAEMKTGEGKTLVATLPIYLNALLGKGVHLVTVNSYLAQRDAEWMGRIYNFLGMDVGVIVANLSDSERQHAYGCDITYGTNNEFGFDYLRDNMKYSLDRQVQRRGLNYAIIDEVDSILVDEARTPLIISGRAEQSTELYYTINEIIPFLKKDEDYIVDEEHHSVTLTDEGVARCEQHLKLENLYEPANIEYLHHVNKALQAHTLYKKDNRYIVDDGQVIIVDEHTGRPMPGRRWSDGLHQAVEAKEGVKVRDENQTLATVTFQNFFRMYDKLAGMTGTAETEAEEFKEIYELDVRVIPTNKPVIRADQNDVIYRTEREKFKAIVDQILACHAKGQPVLVGTVSVEKSEAISKVLKRKKISHTVLNAKYHRREADIVAQAGRKGGITIATNMAGRGTDILLGGNPEALAEKSAKEGTEDFAKRVAHFQEVCAKEKQQVLDAGGLFILGTERHESRRIDNQLRGRAGRQGDPGESRFFLSLEDDLLRIFNAEKISYIMERLDMPEGEPIEANMVSKAIENAQKRVEGRNFDIRKNLLEYDDVMDQQRKTIYGLRDTVLEGGDAVYEAVLDAFDRVAVATLDNHCPEKVKPDDWDLEGLVKSARETFNITVELPDDRKRDNLETWFWQQIENSIAEKEQDLQYIADATNARFEEVEDYEEKTGRGILIELMQNTYLKAIDKHWREHLKAMDALRDAIRFHGYAQKDPKKVYKIEGYDQFEKTMAQIDTNLIEYLTKMQVEREDQVHDIAPDAVRIRAVQAPEPKKPTGPAMAPAPTAGGPVAMTELKGAPKNATSEPQEASGGSKVETVQRELPKIGRNEPCPCGSGKKFKRCHMGREDELAGLMEASA